MDVRSFLKLPLSEEFKLLAGKSGINNKITGVNILDNPKAMDWLSPGELIVTSGYFFKDSPDALKNFLESFSRSNIAAICIKTKLYLTPIPTELINLCDAFSIPLIEIPYGIAFSKIMNTVMNLLSDSSTESAQMAMDINSKFMEYGLKGEGIDYLRQKLEGLLDNPLIITNADWNLLSNSSSDSFLPYILNKNQRLYFDTESLASLPANMNKLKHPINIVFKDGANGMILPVFFNDVTYGYIIVLQKVRPLLQKDFIVLEHASITIALKIAHQTENDRINNRILRDFYRELLFGNGQIEELRSFDIEFDYDIPYCVFIITIDISNNTVDGLLQQKYEEDMVMRNLFNAATHYQHPTYTDIHLFKQGKHIIGLLGDKAKNQQTFFSDFDQYLRSYLTPHSVIQFFIGSIQDISQLNLSYKEAKKIIDYADTGVSGIYFSHQFYFENFIQSHINEEEALEFVNHYLLALIDYDKKTESNLVETLEIYLQQSQNLAASSRLLFIHRNTLLYRIERIETLLDCDLSDPSINLSLSVALKFFNIYSRKFKDA